MGDGYNGANLLCNDGSNQRWSAVISLKNIRLWGRERDFIARGIDSGSVMHGGEA